MRRKSRQLRRIWVAVFCCLPAALVLLVWLVGSASSALRPGRAMPEGTAVGIQDHGLYVYSASHALEIDDLPPELRPPTTGDDAAGTVGRRFGESARAMGVVDVRRGAEWHGRFATRFTLVVVPMWLLLLATLPLLLVAAWQIAAYAAAERRRRTPRCLNCGAVLPPGSEQCPECGHKVALVDEVGKAMLGAAAPAGDASAGKPAAGA
jgi:hypothetical protein